MNLRLSSYEIGNQSFKTWCNKLGHLHDDMNLKIMAGEEIVDGSRILKKDSQCNFCEGCVFRKIHKRSFLVNEVRKKTRKVGELIHADICGPMSVFFIRGPNYYVPFKGNYPRFCFVYCVITKVDPFQCFEDVYH
jgi:hypothetical protein